VDIQARRVERILPGGSDPENFAVSADGARLFVSNEDANAASIVDVATGRIVATVPVGREPEGVGVRPGTSEVWVTGETDHDVTILDGSDGRHGPVLGRVVVDRRPRNVAFSPDGATIASGSCDWSFHRGHDWPRPEWRGAEKCEWLKKTCGLDEVIDYKAENVERRLSKLCPRGIDVFFDNVGGAILEAGIEHIAERGRIVLCGGISSYNDAERQPGPRNLMNLVVRRVRMEGFIMMDFMSRIGEAIAALSQWVFAGRIQYRNDIQEGFENIPKTFLRLFSGENQGKQMLRLAAPE